MTTYKSGKKTYKVTITKNMHMPSDKAIHNLALEILKILK